MTEATPPDDREPDDNRPDPQDVEFPEPSVHEPEPVNEAELEGFRAAIRRNCADGLENPLQPLAPAELQRLVALGFHDSVALIALENQIRTWLEETGLHTAAVVRRFGLRVYQRQAEQLRRRIEADRERVRRLAERNMRMIDGGRGPGRSPPRARRAQGALGANGVNGGTPGVEQITEPDQMLESNSPLHWAIGHLLTKRRGRIWRDDYHGDSFTDWLGGWDDRVVPVRRIDDDFVNNVHSWLHACDHRLARKGPKSNTENALMYVTDKDRRNEPLEWLRSLQWDGQERLKFMLPGIWHTTDSEYHMAVGRCWLVSMCRRIIQPGAKVDTMPVFVGPQGAGKSQALEILGGKWYATINTSAESKDFQDALRGVMLGEVAEMDAIAASKVDVRRVKTLLSTRIDRYRPAYGRTTKDFPRTCVLAGTTNDTHWHHDETGFRRFWPVIVDEPVDLGFLEELRDQLFAEAFHLAQQPDADWWTVPEDEQRTLMEAALIEDSWKAPVEAILTRWRAPGPDQVWDGWNGARRLAASYDPLDADGYWGTLVTLHRVLVQGLGFDSARIGKREENRIAKIMDQLGWRKRDVRCVDTAGSPKFRVWELKQEPDSMESHNATFSQGPREDEIPF